MGTQNETVTKYLDRYAEAEAAVRLPGKRYAYSLVIPAFNEDHDSVIKVWRRIKPGTSLPVSYTHLTLPTKRIV